MKAFTEKEIKDKLKDFTEWEYYDDAIHTEIEFGNFKDFTKSLINKTKS